MIFSFVFLLKYDNILYGEENSFSLNSVNNSKLWLELRILSLKTVYNNPMGKCSRK